jgi:hypothetical protein
MPDLSIPKKDRRGLVILLKIPDKAFQAIMLKLDRSPVSIPKIDSLSAEDSELLFDAIKTLYRVHAHHDEISLDEFVSDICEALREHSELIIDEEPRFRDRLENILKINAPRIAAKAISIGYEYEHLFCSARIITDARPVYGDNVSESPAAMVITHNLKITYHGAPGELKEIFIGLGSEDIRELRTVLDRAEEKAKSLQAAFGVAKLKFIDPQKE